MISLEPPRGADTAHAPGRSTSEKDLWMPTGLSRAGLARFLGTASAAVGLRGEVDVLLAGDSTLRRLNRSYRGKNKATDVLSFPAAPELQRQHAGDLAISLETAARQAEEHGHGLREEVRILMLHGLLHLHGLDHETDAGEMAAKEAELRRRLRLPTGLIARAEPQAGRPKERARSTSKSPARSGARRRRA